MAETLAEAKARGVEAAQGCLTRPYAAHRVTHIARHRISPEDSSRLLLRALRRPRRSVRRVDILELGRRAVRGALQADDVGAA